MSETRAILDRNADCERADKWFKRKHGFAVPNPSEVSLDGYEQMWQEWKRRTGYDRFMRRIHSLTYRRHGFVKSPYGGWMWPHD